MIDGDGFIALIAAVVERSRLDVHTPSGSRMGSRQRAELQKEAIDFLQWVDAQREELTDLAACATVVVSHRTHGGSFRWEMFPSDLRTQKRLSAQRRKREQLAGNNDAGRKRVSEI